MRVLTSSFVALVACLALASPAWAGSVTLELGYAGNVTAAMAANAISVAPSQMLEAGAGNLIGLDGASLVPPGGIG